MASIILSSAASSIGKSFTSGIGQKLLQAGAKKAGRLIDQKVGWSTSRKLKDGSRLEGFSVQDSKYGITIPSVYGRSRIAGNVIWASDLIETRHNEPSGSGKGGAISSVFGASRTTYTYSLNCAIGICNGSVTGIETIWADSTVIYQNGIWMSGVVLSASIHKGDADPEVDPLLESWIGLGEVPSFKGVSYIVLEGLQLRYFGNRLPNLTFEVHTDKSEFNPVWLGEVSSTQKIDYSSLNSGAVKPLAISGSNKRTATILVGGYHINDTDMSFSVTAYDVTSDVPIELYKNQSESFLTTEVANQSSALSTDNRYAVYVLQANDETKSCYYVLYDVLNQSFGHVLRYQMDRVEDRQVVWFDAYHFAVTDVENNVRGLRVFVRNGTSILHLGFYDVWGDNSAYNRFPISTAQFCSYGDGLICFAGDQESNFTSFYGVYISWAQNNLFVEKPYEIYSNYSFGSGANPQFFLFPSGDQEITLIFTNVLNIQMMSFIPNRNNAFVKKGWKTFYSNVWFISKNNIPLIRGDKLYVLHVTNVESSFRLSEFDITDSDFKLVHDAILIDGYTAAGSYYSFMDIDTTQFVTLSGSGYNNELSCIGSFKIRDTSNLLSFVVSDILKKAGYSDEDLNLQALENQTIDGYALTKKLTANSVLGPLQFIGGFDLIESDGLLVAKTIGSDVNCNISDDELIPRFIESRVEGTNLPHEMELNYLDADRDYEIGTQYARKINFSGARETETINLPLVCSPSKAKQVAENQLYKRWGERNVYHLKISNAFMFIEPGDIIQCKNHNMRVIDVSSQKHVHSITAVAVLKSCAVTTSIAEGGPYNYVNAEQVIPTILYLMDLPMLRSVDDQAGLYVAVGGINGWKGASLFRSFDNVNFVNQSSFLSKATTGVVTKSPSIAVPYILDTVSEVYVQLVSGSLSSCSYLDLLNGQNVAVCGKEIIQFQYAQLIGDGLYKLSHLIRGQKLTHDFIDKHDLGESFILLKEDSIKFIRTSLSDRDRTYHFRAVSDGNTIDYAQDHLFNFGLKTLCPYPPCHIRSYRLNGKGSDLYVKWIRQARKNTSWIDFIDVPLDEDSEIYDVEIMNGENIIRTFSGLTDTSFNYTSSDQLIDWSDQIPDFFSIKIYQVSSRYGRGEPAFIIV